MVSKWESLFPSVVTGASAGGIPGGRAAAAATLTGVGCCPRAIMFETCLGPWCVRSSAATYAPGSTATTHETMPPLGTLVGGPCARRAREVEFGSWAKIPG